MFTRQWWKAASKRAARSAAQAFLVAFGTDQLHWLNLDWKQVLISTIGMGVASYATSIALPPEEAGVPRRRRRKHRKEPA